MANANLMIENSDCPGVKQAGQFNTRLPMNLVGTAATLTVAGAVTLPASTTIGGSSVSALGVVTATSANALTVGPAGTTNPSFNVDTSGGVTDVTGININSNAAASGVAITVLSSGTDESLSVAAKGAGVVKVQDPVATHLPTAINSTATATAAQVATGYITSTSAAATAITLPTGTALGTALGAVQGTIHDLFIDNTAGANTVTIVVAVNGILSAAAAANGASQGLLTVPSGVTGQACFRLMFSSATAYTFTRIA